MMFNLIQKFKSASLILSIPSLKVGLKTIGLKRLIIIVFLAFFGINSTTYAQTQENSIDKVYEQLIYIEADPLAYINKGYSIHLGYENWGYRFDLTKVKVDFPESFEDAFYGTKAFDLKTNITGIKLDYIGKRTNWTKGAFVGLDINHQTLNFSHRATNVSEDLTTFNLGVRVGYKIKIYKGFYVTPWAALWRNVLDTQSFTVGNDLVSTNNWDWITTLHFGYAIKL